jgi:hypothetical protein
MIGEDNINWETFEVTDPEAPEFTAPEGEAEAPDADLAPEDTAQEGRPRDPETGQFVSAAPEEPAAPDPVEAVLAKYGGDVDKALQGLVEAQSLIGRRDDERARLEEANRILTEQLGQQQQAPVQQAPPPMPSPDALDRLMETEGMAGAAEAMLRDGNLQAHQAVIAHWRTFDVDAATMYQMTAQTRFDAWQANQRAEILAQNQATSSLGSRLEQTWTRLVTEIPDLEALRPAMLAETQQPGGDIWAPLLESGDPDKVYYAVRTLALAARNRDPNATSRLVAENARTAAVESQRARTEAMVTTTGPTGPDPTQPTSYDDELLAKFQEEDKAREDGWKIGSGSN